MVNVLCFVFGHKYRVVREFSYTSRKVGCARCGRKWGMNDETRSFVPWDGEFDKLYSEWPQALNFKRKL